MNVQQANYQSFLSTDPVTEPSPESFQ